jgi:ActR/RegA family two-component response regulator
MAATPLDRVLFVDDEPRVLDGLRRQLHGLYDVVTTTSPAEALAILGADPPPVVVSDYAMPDLTGAVLLAHACKVAPDTTRLLLTGQADLVGAVAAVNEGRIFRFLLKPASFDDIAGALKAAVEQHRLVTSERVLLEQTLRGSVQALVETLSLANPSAFARSNRIHQITARLLEALDVADAWAIEVAALLSELGAVTLPPHVIDRLRRGEALSEAEAAMVANIPAATEQILAAIPRLDDVRDVLRHLPDDARPGRTLGARVVRLAADFEALESAGTPAGQAVQALHGRHDGESADLVRLLGELFATTTSGDDVLEVTMYELEPGMTLAQDLCTGDGVLLVPKGNQVTPSVIARVQNFAAVTPGASPKIRVLPPSGS